LLESHGIKPNVKLSPEIVNDQNWETKICFVGQNMEQNKGHCNENPIYVFPEKELHGLSPNFHIHGSVRDLYIPRIGPPIFLQ
jgi:hypothetical protein